MGVVSAGVQDSILSEKQGARNVFELGGRYGSEFWASERLRRQRKYRSYIRDSRPLTAAHEMVG
jgi:hypothetical protein